MLDDDQFKTLLVLGFLFRKLGLDDKASRLYQTLLALRPDDPSLLAPAAAAALAEGRGEDSLDLLERLEASGSQNFQPVHWLIRAKAYAALERPEEAHKAALKYIEGLPNEGDKSQGDK
ncbi:MAG: hypothetical protein LBE31_00295 [Deltaproteobacteria bacterium]|jgi:tetratricopeptide (TPR) repeat protein|nr:hypothetical protein [Deltaproteobacteria bacterium]